MWRPPPECSVWLHDEEGGREAVVIGTHHASPASVALVRSAVAQLRPDAVVVELCSERADRPERLRGGAELRAAIEVCKEERVPVVLGDRPESETRTRRGGGWAMVREAWSSVRSLPWTERWRLLVRLWALPARPGTREELREAYGLLRSVLPRFVSAVLDERDAVLAASIRAAPGTRVVAVVGLAHLDGIERCWSEQQRQRRRRD